MYSDQSWNFPPMVKQVTVADLGQRIKNLMFLSTGHSAAQPFSSPWQQ
jgi:hypothetical protein